MIWLIIIAIVVIGYLVIAAVNNNTRANLMIEAQRRIDAENERQKLELEKQEAYESSPEYKTQQYINAAYNSYLFKTNMWKTMMLEREIKYYPDLAKAKQSSKSTYAKSHKEAIEGLRESLDQAETEWKQVESQYPGCRPDNIERVKNESMHTNETTLLSGYEQYIWEVNRIGRLKRDLSDVKKGVDIKSKRYKEVLHHIKTNMKSGDKLSYFEIIQTFFLDNSESSEIKKQLEADGVISAGAFSRVV